MAEKTKNPGIDEKLEEKKGFKGYVKDEKHQWENTPIWKSISLGAFVAVVALASSLITHYTGPKNQTVAAPGKPDDPGFTPPETTKPAAVEDVLANVNAALAKDKDAGYREVTDFIGETVGSDFYVEEDGSVTKEAIAYFKGQGGNLDIDGNYQQFLYVVTSQIKEYATDDVDCKGLFEALQQGKFTVDAYSSVQDLTLPRAQRKDVEEMMSKMNQEGEESYYSVVVNSDERDSLGNATATVRRVVIDKEGKASIVDYGTRTSQKGKTSEITADVLTKIAQENGITISEPEPEPEM